MEVGFRNSSSLPRKHENIGLLVTGYSVSLLLYPILSALAVWVLMPTNMVLNLPRQSLCFWGLKE